MNDKKEDLILTGAFGELNPNEEAALLASLSDSERKEFDLLVGLRRDMRVLDVPEECQVSVEMMRDRILSAGVSPKTGWNFRWLTVAAPLAACFIAGVFLMRPTTPEPKLIEVAQSEVLEPAPMPAPDLKPANVLPKATIEMPVSEGEVESDPEPAAVVASKPRPTAKVRKVTRQPRVRASGGNVASKPKALTAPLVREPAPEVAISAPGAMDLAASSGDEVVVISSDTVSETGTQSAQEVASASGVVIDG